MAIHTAGNVHGGQQPVAGAQVYLYAVSASNGGASTSLLTAPGFVLTDLNGNFSITGSYTCPSGAYVYLLAVGGNPGLLNGNNTEIALAAGLGPCASLSSSSLFMVNEVTTVAFANAVSGFASSATQIGTSASLATTFAYYNTLVNPTTGLANADTATNTLPQRTLNSLANAIATCVNSTGVGAPCSTLMSAASNATPANTFQAALNIAKNPSANVSTIYNLSTPNAVFQPTQPSAPGNWTLQVTNSSGQIFADPNTYAFTTPVGTFCVELRPDVTPLTVANFRYYVNNGSYVADLVAHSGMITHRSVANFGFQGGGYAVVNNQTQVIGRQASVTNEFNLSNVRGTLALAFIYGQPNSGTSEWFVNVKDNSATLDSQQVTVFGNVVGVAGYTSGGCASTAAGLAVTDAVNALQTVNAGVPFTELPVINYASGATANNLVYTNIAPANPQ